ncbi:dTDP-glucose 4,6-dehydratase [Nitrosopumilus sp.]|uniref:dTDP-glucose 4,6-dehydratase n=1 Tax=Nitrosopumilus sp. TaxID=2024843 RepID=UPI003D0D3BE0
MAKILVTGGLGFIGSNFILFSIKKDSKIKITNIDACLTGSNKKNLKELKNSKNYKFVKANINNQKIIDDLVSKNDVIINFAAESHVDRSISNPRPFIQSNINGTYTILEAIRKYDKTLVHISTDEVYGSLKKNSATEIFPLNPSSPYSSSKASADLLVKSYHTTYGCDVKITRCTNNYGPRQFTEKLIPKVIINAMKNKSIPVYGNGKNIRDWLYVIDHCRAIRKVMTNGKSGEIYNIAGKNEINNNTIIKMILRTMNKPLSLMKYVKDRPGHDFRYSLDSTKIEKKLNWNPKFDFENGIKETIAWYLNNKSWWMKQTNV